MNTSNGAIKTDNWNLELLEDDSGYQVPLEVFRPEDHLGNYVESSLKSNIECDLEGEPATKQHLMLLPAMGMAARYYRPFAQQLARQNITVYLFEQRGHGHSSMRPGRKCNYGFKEYIADIELASAYVSEKHDNQPINLMGHSLGGHLASCFTALNPNQVDRIILSGCASPYHKAFDRKTGFLLQGLYHSIPLMNKVLGYYHGEFTGFAGKEGQQLMLDWRNLVLTNIYKAKGVEKDFEHHLQGFSGDILSLQFSEDIYAPPQPSQLVLDKYPAANIETITLTSDDLGFSADHFRWARKPEVSASTVHNWLVKS
ncbi:alpha/beta fold hydrolase [Thalassotalea sp. PS06]|uniref:alpha/beta hydrolase family protein n=1 Tax=Thalassotalea sp. PS06 TaxID=2594005 RepID=UPI0011628A34|nr:alpha/beta fold hydrolase [Thalassotalea sp. PS06]QDP00968.1 alpha/beta fold hydrolase [Thalassotalea sp. PS06]